MARPVLQLLDVLDLRPYCGCIDGVAEVLEHSTVGQWKKTGMMESKRKPLGKPSYRDMLVLCVVLSCVKLVVHDSTLYRSSLALNYVASVSFVDSLLL